MSYPDLKDQTVLVTGGATGIGAELVRAFFCTKAHVVFCDINQKAGKKLASELGQKTDNLRVYFLTSREVVPYMPKKDAAIINLSSITFYLGWPELSCYVAAKGGIVGLIRIVQPP